MTFTYQNADSISIAKWPHNAHVRLAESLLLVTFDYCMKTTHYQLAEYHLQIRNSVFYVNKMLLSRNVIFIVYILHCGFRHIVVLCIKY